VTGKKKKKKKKKSAESKGPKRKTVARNRRAFKFYNVEDKFEAGLVLVGSEVKSLRDGKVDLKDGYARPKNNEVYLLQVRISQYANATHENHEPDRPRKLLLHKREIKRLIGRTTQQGYTILPLEIYFNERGIAKVLLGLAKGKSKFDQRDDIREREAKEEMERALRRRIKKR